MSCVNHDPTTATDPSPPERRYHYVATVEYDSDTPTPWYATTELFAAGIADAEAKLTKDRPHAHVLRIYRGR